MSKKGLTLVELLAVIAIIAILVIMIMPGIMTVRNSVLESSYENKVSQIVTAGKDYGQEHITELKSPVNQAYIKGVTENSEDPDCIYRTINFLINNGYLKTSNTYVVGGSESSDFVDPRSNEPMNNMSVCIRFDNNNIMTRQVIAYLIER